jgi:hypothetical protein
MQNQCAMMLSPIKLKNLGEEKVLPTINIVSGYSL